MMETHTRPRSSPSDLDEVIVRDVEGERGRRPRDLEAENRGLNALAEELARRPHNLLQRLAEVALEMARGDSAGVSVAEPSSQAGTDPPRPDLADPPRPDLADPPRPAATDPPRQDGTEPPRAHAAGPLRRHVVVGEVAGVERESHCRGPCELTLQRGEILLFHRPVRLFPQLERERLPVEEVLVAPFRVEGGPAGTVWVMSHSPGSRFDAEDARLLASVARFAAAGYQLTTGVDALRRGQAELEGRVDERTRELTEANRALARSEARLEATFARAAAGLSEVSLQGRFLRVNNELCRMLGRSREELLQLGVTDVTHPEDVAPSVAAFNELVDTGRPASLEKRYLRADGTIVAANSALTRLDDEEGLPRAILAVTIDLTERVRAEEDLRRREQQLRGISRSLEGRVAERTRALREQTVRLRHLAAELASAEQRERKRLAALLHDELQQLLVAAEMQLVGVARSLRDGGAVKAVSQAAEWVAQARDAARDLTRELRPPALYEDGLAAALRWLASEIAERHRLLVTVEAERVSRDLDDDIKAFLFECVRELLFNVVKYADVEEAEVRIEESEGWLHVVVVDRGRGFEVETTSREHSGSGFGLFSIRERVAALGGAMSIESAPGQGTHIAVELPLDLVRARSKGVGTAVATADASGTDVVAPPDTDRRIRVVVVDDHTVVRQGIANLLDRDSRIAVVGEAADGIQALDLVEREQPDIVLMDVNMPRMNGIQTTEEIVRLWPDALVIGLSVQDDDATARSMRDAGAAAFLPKSGDADRFIDTIMGLVARR